MIPRRQPRHVPYVSLRASTPHEPYIFTAQSLAASCRGEPVRRGPTESISTWASEATWESSIPISQMRWSVGSRISGCAGTRRCPSASRGRTMNNTVSDPMTRGFECKRIARLLRFGSDGSSYRGSELHAPLLYRCEGAVATERPEAPGPTRRRHRGVARLRPLGNLCTSVAGLVGSAMDPDSRRRDDAIAQATDRSSNDEDGSMPPQPVTA